MPIEQHFSSDYAEARTKFLDACKARGLTVRSHENTGVQGPNGERLFADVGRLGPESATRLLAITSATHGVEGFAGSGCQVALLSAGLELPDDLGLLLIHGVNPHGFAHERRVTEENVDLNRNFIDFDRLPVNEGYDELHPSIVPEQYVGPAKEEADLAIQGFMAKNGPAAFQAVVQRGQYTCPDGIFYGGTEPTWCHEMLRQVVAEEMQDVEKLALIDIHTGLGERGVGEVIFIGSGRPELERARSWFGEVTCPGGDDSISAELTGMSSRAYADAEGAEVTRIALEFGTIEMLAVFEALRADNWLYARGGGDTSSEAGRKIKALVRRAFYGEDAEWKQAIWSRTRAVVRQAIEGLS